MNARSKHHIPETKATDAAMPRMCRVMLSSVFAALLLTQGVNAQSNQKGYPKYCKTEVGVLGPYNNTSVPEGGACFGTKNGKRYDGTAVYGPNDDSQTDDGSTKKGYPKYCKTEVGVLGPYNNTSVPERGACFGTKNGKRYDGTAVYGPND